MATLRINIDRIKEAQAARSIKDFANEVGINPSSMSRVLDGTTKTPGPGLIAGLLTTTPHTFPYFFEVVEEVAA
jgi:hypothetical protein